MLYVKTSPAPPMRSSTEDRGRHIAALVHTRAHVTADMPVVDVAALFEADPLCDALAVIDGPSPICFVSRARFTHTLSSRYGFALFHRRPIRRLVETDPMVVDAAESSLDVITTAMRRSSDRIYDDIVVTEGGAYAGLVSVRRLFTHGRDLLASSMETVSSLEVRNEQLRELNRMQREFTATMTHELRAPLNAMLGLVMVIESDPTLSADSRSDIRRLLQRGRGLLHTVNDLLDMHKLDAGSMKPVFESVDLADLVAEQIDIATHLVGSPSVVVRADTEAMPASWSTDSIFLRRILTNLLSNAAKFTVSGELVLRVTSDGNTLLCAVSDTGEGIRPGDLSKLFTRFTQLESVATRRHGGTGLGLAIAAELTRLLRGTLTVRSVVGVGSTFTLRVPLATREQGLTPSLREVPHGRAANDSGD